MSERPISPLRRRMVEDMVVRRLGEKTKSNYIYHVESFTAFLGRSPDTAAAEDVRRFQVHLTETGVGPSSINQAATALRFFFGPTVDRPELARHLARVHYPRKLPRVQVSHAKYRSVSGGARLRFRELHRAPEEGLSIGPSSGGPFYLHPRSAGRHFSRCPSSIALVFCCRSRGRNL
jgi:hypothetical protein